MEINTKPIIRVNNLSKNFGEYLAVDQISFFVEKGEIFAFLGPNGAGKTTTIKILTTLLRPSKGEATVNGFDVVREKEKVRQSFGIVFQEQSLDDELTAYENMHFHAILYGLERKEMKTKIETLLKFVELWERRKSLVKTFSSGMKRRLEVARSFLHHPKIIFLDEPTLGLDPQTRSYIWQYILNLNQEEGITVFFTTHYLDEAERIAQKVAIIDEGKIVAQGSVKDLKKQTKTSSLEQAYLTLVGKKLRQEVGGSFEQMQKERKLWQRKP
ncbi:MAG TPA: ATP-binding cassette domain-containing protein [Clostridia bacterium]|nr:ATP-binding cassette domain-containing protein [Clostridia bacterium]